MTKSQTPDDPSPIDPELARILVEERADEAWAEYVMNEQPSALARYLMLGGEVTDVVRAALIDALKDHPGGRRGGSRPYRDWQTYLEIELMLKSDGLDGKFDRLSNDNDQVSSNAKSLSRQKALEAYAAKTHQETRTVQLQDKRGREIEAQFKELTKK